MTSHRDCLYRTPIFASTRPIAKEIRKVETEEMISRMDLQIPRSSAEIELHRSQIPRTFSRFLPAPRPRGSRDRAIFGSHAVHKSAAMLS